MQPVPDRQRLISCMINISRNIYRTWKIMQDPLLKGVHFIWGPCNEVVGSRHSEWNTYVWDKTDERKQLRDWYNFTLKGSQMPTLKQLLYFKGEKQPQTKEKTDRLLRSPYNYWSMHGLYQSNLSIFTALMDTIIPFPIIKCIVFPKGNCWNYQKSHM